MFEVAIYENLINWSNKLIISIIKSKNPINTSSQKKQIEEKSVK